MYVFSSHIVQIEGWVGQSEFASYANWKNHTQKWTTPNNGGKLLKLVGFLYQPHLFCKLLHVYAVNSLINRVL